MADNETIHEAICKRLEQMDRFDKRYDFERALDTLKEFMLELYDHLTEQKGNER